MANETGSNHETHQTKTAGTEAGFWGLHQLVICFFTAMLICTVVYGIVAYIHYRSFVCSQERLVQLYQDNIEKAGDGRQLPANAYLQRYAKEQETFQQEVKSMLDLEFNRIQHEFESLEIWAGVLTVIFLIFSFYSLQKTEQMEHESKKGMEKIKEIMTEAASKQTTFETESNSKLTTFDTDKDTKFRTFDSDKANKFNTFESEKTTKFNEIDSKLKSVLDKFSEDSQKELKGIDDRIAQSQRNVIAEGKNNIEGEKNQAIEDFKKQSDNLREGYVQEFKKLLEDYRKNLGDDYKDYKQQLDAVSIEISYLQKQLSNQPDDEDIKDIRAQAEIPDSDDE